MHNLRTKLSCIKDERRIRGHEFDMPAKHKCELHKIRQKMVSHAIYVVDVFHP
jgi:hypothetical protein